MPSNRGFKAIEKKSKHEGHARGARAPQVSDDQVEVLYQKMGDRWFAFSLIEDEIFVASFTPDEINKVNPGTKPPKDA